MSRIRGRKHVRGRRPGKRGTAAYLLGAVVAFLLVVVLGITLYAADKVTYMRTASAEGNPSRLGLKYEDVEYRSREDGLRLSAWYIYPRGAGKSCSVVMVHGKDNNRDDRGIGTLDIAQGLSSRGYSVLMPDLRAHGKSEGNRFTLGYYERRDVLGAVDYLNRRPDSRGCVMGLGFSTGAVSLIGAAAVERDIRAVVADGAWPDPERILNRELPAYSGLPPFFTPLILQAAQVMYGADLDSAKPVDMIDDIAPRPIMLIQAGNDRYIPEAEARMLYSQVKSPASEYWLSRDTAHVKAYKKQPEEYLRRVTRFFDAALPRR